MLARTLIVIILMLAGASYLTYGNRQERIPLRESLVTFPLHIGDWRGEDLPAFDSKIMAVLGVDEYLNRSYRSNNGSPIFLYIGYYQSQRQGDTIHSPLNCLPGAGWEPISSNRIRLSALGYIGLTSGDTIEINQIIIRKGLDRQVVLYWYQSHNRVVASEYWGKIYTVLDAIQYNRTDAALIRIISPISSTVTEQDSERAALEFAKSIFPLLVRYLPPSGYSTAREHPLDHETFQESSS